MEKAKDVGGLPDYIIKVTRKSGLPNYATKVIRIKTYGECYLYYGEHWDDESQQCNSE